MNNRFRSFHFPKPLRRVGILTGLLQAASRKRCPRPPSFKFFLLPNFYYTFLFPSLHPNLVKYFHFKANGFFWVLLYFKHSYLYFKLYLS